MNDKVQECRPKLTAPLSSCLNLTRESTSHDTYPPIVMAHKFKPSGAIGPDGIPLLFCESCGVFSSTEAGKGVCMHNMVSVAVASSSNSASNPRMNSSQTSLPAIYEVCHYSGVIIRSSTVKNNSNTLGVLEWGAQVEVLEIYVVGTAKWARHARGWSYMAGSAPTDDIYLERTMLQSDDEKKLLEHYMQTGNVRPPKCGQKLCNNVPTNTCQAQFTRSINCGKSFCDKHLRYYQNPQGYKGHYCPACCKADNDKSCCITLCCTIL